MWFVLAFLCCLSVFAASPAALLDPAPVRFEPNPGLQEGNTNVRWSARGLGYAFQFTDDATILRVGDRSVKLTFPGSRVAAKFDPAGRMAVATNYFVGKKHASVPAFSKLRRIEVYPGIDVVYYGNGREVEYDFEVSPGADPSRIRMRFDGADAVQLNDRGEIVLTLGSGEMTQRAPVVYQRRTSGEIVAIEGNYKLDAKGVARLALGSYDRHQPLIVDPTILYAAYLAGTSTDSVAAIAHDAQGKVYLAGSTLSNDFPATTASDQPYTGGAHDAWVMQLDPTAGANAIVYCSYLGGVGDEIVHGLAIDQNNLIYITGSTNGSDFPVTSGALQSTIAGNQHAFVSVFDPSQQGTASLIYSTFLGGTNNDEGDGIAVAKGKIYVTGWTTSDDFPVAGAYQGTRKGGYDAFVVELDPTQSGAASLIAGTYYGGSGEDRARSIVVDSAGQVYIAGQTYSFDLPLAGGSSQSTYRSGGDGFLAQLDLGAATLKYATFLGGSGIDDVKKIIVASSGNIALTGYTTSADFPVTQNAYKAKFGGASNAFLSVLSTTGQGLVYSTYFGGSGGEVGYDLRQDAAGRFYLGGYTLSPDFPITSNAMNSASIAGSIDGFVTILDPTQPALNGKQLVYSSYVTSGGFQIVYGIDVDANGTIYVAGTTTGNVFSSTPPNATVGKSSTFLMLFSLP